MIGKERVRKMKKNTGRQIKNRKISAVDEAIEYIGKEKEVDHPIEVTKQEKLFFRGGVASTVKPQLHLIPHAALVGLANRFQLGQEKYGSRAWNGLSNQVVLEDKEWLKERISHIIDHAYLYLQKLEGIISDDGDDDASAIMWGGACLFEAKRIGENKK